MTRAGRAAGLSALISRAARAGKGLPPVERWNPQFCGDIDMEIRPDGTWFYMGTPIGRMPLVQLFSTVLRKDEDGKTYLVTPVEKVGIRVADAPFVAVEMNVSGEGGEQVMTFRTNVGDVVEAGPDHPLRFVDEAATGGLKPYVLVRGRLEALVARPVMYELVDAWRGNRDRRRRCLRCAQGRGLPDHAGRRTAAAERLNGRRSPPSLFGRGFSPARGARARAVDDSRSTATTVSIPEHPRADQGPGCARPRCSCPSSTMAMRRP